MGQPVSEEASEDNFWNLVVGGTFLGLSGPKGAAIGWACGRLYSSAGVVAGLAVLALLLVLGAIVLSGARKKALAS